MPKKRLFWRIEGYDGTKLIFKEYRPLGSYSERQITQALKALVARECLTREEALDSYAKRNTKKYATHLETSRSSGPEKLYIECGQNPYFIASVVEEGNWNDDPNIIG